VGVALCAAVATVASSPALAEDTPGSTVSFFSDSSTPDFANFDDTNSNELGLKFKSDVSGTVTAIRFYKGSKNTGTHTGSLWTADGHVLATATFSGETESGWQTLTFASPVAIDADTTYVASYHTEVGFYAVNRNAFATAGLDSGPLHVAPNGAAYHDVDGSFGAGFPNVASDHNYWVDIVFKPEQDMSPSASPSTSAPAGVPSSAPATVPSPTPSRSAAGGAGGSLPITGTNVGLIAGLGLLLAAVGAALFLVYRRRNPVKFIA
jgi:LPXTG-motif cell wall-anchored protein